MSDFFWQILINIDISWVEMPSQQEVTDGKI